MITEITRQLLSGVMRLSFRFEPFFPQFMRLSLNRKLMEYKKRGLIADYSVRARRIEKHHYFFEVDLFLDENREVKRE